MKNWVASRIRAFVGDFGTSVESVSMKRSSSVGSSQGKPEYGLGINRRNKLCRWVEIAGKIEFADSAALVGERGASKIKKKKREKRVEGKSRTDKSLQSRGTKVVPRRGVFAFPLFSFFPPGFWCLHYRSRQQLFDPAVEIVFLVGRFVSPLFFTRVPSIFQDNFIFAWPSEF